MINRNPYAKYQQNQVQTANPEKLIILLYEGAIKFLGQAKVAVEQKEYDKANNYIGRTQDIISELMTSLNMEFEIAKNLYSLYDYLFHRLIQANVKKDITIIKEVQDMMSELKETWAQAIVMTKSGNAVSTNGVNYSG